MKALKMDTEIPDAESRVVKIGSDFHVLLDGQGMDEFPITEPQTVGGVFVCCGGTLRSSCLDKYGAEEIC
ncbi:hypothetical protein PF005_g5479 [Phytophthora fragariae]|uniref:Uncharacterized protein n=1 Tax=Phytophthora fragariae TaxID=53985 RepID=A0A6A4A282_9STRA|nr:hypothetical protein PF003_g22866 [Phytophthora fragariae]KAE8944304.1 hypothetical protein PF009_g6004 [Phytophthora fragariae]KAE9022447.1 hypothetical protein PF011_g4460 [Phytophthora fragariae]KAE9127618.1 hypothetical protein PF007_g5547 [Phytophthora fragariae]KAE9150986.1 hypothetical protein PF006_g4686 [Phytophthora fragariae]